MDSKNDTNKNNIEKPINNENKNNTTNPNPTSNNQNQTTNQNNAKTKPPLLPNPLNIDTKNIPLKYILDLPNYFT